MQLLMADRTGPEHHAEAEPVLIEAVGNVVLLELDDGDRLEFNRAELLGAIGLRDSELPSAA